VAFKLRCIQYPAVRRADEIPLPAVRPLERFVIAACRDDASMALECVPEHRLVGNAFGARVEARWQASRAFSTTNEAPAHGDEFGGAASGRQFIENRLFCCGLVTDVTSAPGFYSSEIEMEIPLLRTTSESSHRLGHGLPSRLRGHHDRCTSDSRRLKHVHDQRREYPTQGNPVPPCPSIGPPSSPTGAQVSSGR